MSKAVQFEVDNKKYVAVFDCALTDNEPYIDEAVHWRTIINCSLISLPGRVVTSGAAMLHPRDRNNPIEGERIAFRRAVLSYLLLYEKAVGQEYSRQGIKSAIKLFQKAMGAEKYKLYGKE